MLHHLIKKYIIHHVDLFLGTRGASNLKKGRGAADERNMRFGHQRFDASEEKEAGLGT
jgi:hypothetical protein